MNQGVRGLGRGVTRREVLRAGALSWLGIGLGDLLQARATTGRKPVRGVILAFCPGGPSQLETFDPKPNAPREIRGEFGTIATALAGERFGEHVPELAKRLDRVTLVRSMRTTSPVHELAVHRLLGGSIEPPLASGVAASRHDLPHLGALVAASGYGRPGLPPSVILPTMLEFEGAIFPGQDGGFLGATYDPWHLLGDPGGAEFLPDAMAPADGISVERIQRREELLREFDQARRALDRSLDRAGGPMADFRRQAAAIVTSTQCREAFDLEQEHPAVRDRYGRHLMGQGLLLGRRLVEAGVPLVQVNLGESNVWDTHDRNFSRLKDILLPPFDQAVSALIDDLEMRGLMDEVLVVVTGEFGRTPRVGMPIPGGAGAKRDGRDHWPSVFTVMAFGAGVGRGQILGASDGHAAYPTTIAYTPADLAATLFEALGIDPHQRLTDATGRKFRMNEGFSIPWA